MSRTRTAPQSHTDLSAEVSAHNRAVYVTPGRRHAPYPPPLTGPERARIQKQIGELALRLYPGAGSVTIDTEPTESLGCGPKTIETLIAGRRPDLAPGSVGALLEKINATIVRPKSKELGFTPRYTSDGDVVRGRRNTRAQRHYYYLTFALDAAALWFATFPLDDLRDDDLHVFATARASRYGHDFTPFLPAIRKLLADAGVAVAPGRRTRSRRRRAATH